jgi:hypothetical protein
MKCGFLHYTNNLLEGAPAENGKWIVSEFNRRAEAAELAPAIFWQNITEFWEPKSTERDLALRLFRFHDLINDVKADQGSADSRTTVERREHKRLANVRRAKGVEAVTGVLHPRNKEKVKSGRDRRLYLTKQQAREIWAAASFLVQEYGVLFNTRISLMYGKVGITNHNMAARAVSELTHELGMLVRRRTPNLAQGFHWIYVHEYGNAVGFSTHLVAHILDEYVRDAREWVLERFTQRCAKIAFRHWGHEKQQFRLHWHLVRILSRGLNPDIEVRASDGSRQPLISVLRVPQCLRRDAGIIGCPQRYRVSGTIGDDTRSKNKRLASLSAFSDHAWAYLDRGWELDEHRDREREKEERRRSESKVHAMWPSGGGELQDKKKDNELEKLWASWPDDPRRRRRTWKDRWWQ